MPSTSPMVGATCQVAGNTLERSIYAEHNVLPSPRQRGIAAKAIHMTGRLSLPIAPAEACRTLACAELE
jgi:hypothetical protein